MNEYLLIPRRNPELAAAEVSVYLRARNVEHAVAEIGPSYVVVRAAEFKAARAAEELGATVKVARLAATLSPDEAARASEGDPIPADRLGEFYGVRTVGASLYSSKGALRSKVAESLRDRAARQVADAIAHQQGKKVGVAIGEDPDEGTTAFTPRESRRKGFHEDNVEVVVATGPAGARIGLVVGVCDQAAFDARLELQEKPRGWIYGMAPPLARCLVNLSLATPGKTLLDPFCGVGTVLQEGLAAGVRVVGSDIDASAVANAERNLAALQRALSGPTGSFRVGVRDARDTGLAAASVDCVATEPFLGPGFPKRPSREDAARVVGNLRPLYSGFLRETARVLRPGGSFAIVFPEIETPRGDVGLEPEAMLAAAGLRLRESVVDRHPNQVVARRFVMGTR